MDVFRHALIRRLVTCSNRAGSEIECMKFVQYFDHITVKHSSCESQTILSSGMKYTNRGFQNFCAPFQQWCKFSGLPDCTGFHH